MDLTVDFVGAVELGVDLVLVSIHRIRHHGLVVVLVGHTFGPFDVLIAMLVEHRILLAVAVVEA